MERVGVGVQQPGFPFLPLPCGPGQFAFLLWASISPSPTEEKVPQPPGGEG